jgi:putative FmdB family regulatory protein
VPTYQYVCTECGGQLEAVQKFTDEPLTVHDCGGRLRKVFSPVGIVFKGSGFYRTDSRGKEPSGASSSASPSKESGSKESKEKGSSSSSSDSASSSSSDSSSSSKSGGDSSSSSSASSASSSSGGSAGEKVA